ncbi:hypothetical protein ABNX05_17885 [Lysinibacillus sp. M3]|uniref:Uncharacterized protein n=1 Tax=Lysinibacillus zambalensis TaxID=3160866 RepID=A0ABV1MVH0_9BACI
MSHEVNTVQPFVTCTGNGGVAKIEDQGGGKIWWYVNPKFSTLYSFVGEILISNGKKVVNTIPVSGMGQATKALTDIAYGPSTGGKTYSVKLTGVARDNQGTSSFVVPNCSTAYRK